MSEKTKAKTKIYEPGFYTVSPFDLIGASYNPINRTDATNIVDLVKSISENGQFMPILCDPNLTIIDGHRRHAALVRLDEPMCFIRVVDCDSAKAYAEVNSASKKLSGNDHLNVYLKNPDAMPATARRGMEKMESILGKDGARHIAEKGGSIATFKQAMQVCKYCGVEAQGAWVQSVCKWLMETKQTYSIRKALEEGVAPSVILQCVEQMRPLKRSWGVAL